VSKASAGVARHSRTIAGHLFMTATVTRRATGCPARARGRKSSRPRCTVLPARSAHRPKCAGPRGLTPAGDSGTKLAFVTRRRTSAATGPLEKENEMKTMTRKSDRFDVEDLERRVAPFMYSNPDPDPAPKVPVATYQPHSKTIGDPGVPHRH